MSDGQRERAHAGGLLELIVPAARMVFSVVWQVPTPVPLLGLQQKGWVSHLYPQDFKEWLCWGTAGRCSRTGCTRHLCRNVTRKRDRSCLWLSQGPSCLQSQRSGTASRRFSFQHPLTVPREQGCEIARKIGFAGYCRINHCCKSHGSFFLPYNSGCSCTTH